ncbi:MAG TPA: type IV pili methyl-accepting chemotaxis transducer N-terminal domain-containing protein [Burkholderiales bacterium]
MDLKANAAGWSRRLAQWAGALGVVTLLPLRRQLALLASLLAALLAAALWLAWSEYRQAHLGDAYLLVAAELRTLSQRLAKSALRSLRGEAEAFPQVQASRDDFAAGLARLAKDARAGSALRALDSQWQDTERQATVLLREQRMLTALANAAAGMERGNPQLLERAERVQNLKLARGAAAAEIGAASRLALLSQRMALNAQRLLGADRMDPEVEFLLGKDVNEFRATLARLRANAREDERAALADLAESFGPYQDAVVALLGRRARLAAAKDAAFAIHANSERLLEAVDRVVAEYREQPAPRSQGFALAAVAAATVAALLLVALFLLVDERRQRENIARRHAVLRRHHERDLEAVEQLRREVEQLATGDLTARVSVNSEITYPAAAALNDALDALRGLVKRVALAAECASASASLARSAADGLFEAARRQTERVKGASARSLGMARVVNELSTRANQSAELARAALAAATQGRQAVQAVLEVVSDMGQRVRIAAQVVDQVRGASPEMARSAKLLAQVAVQAEALGASASGRTLVELGALLERLSAQMEQVAAATQSQGASASAIAGGVRETLAGAEQAAAEATRAAAAVEEVATMLTELEAALQSLRT